MRALAFLVALLSSGIMWLNRINSPLPSPAHCCRVEDLDPLLLPQPSTLEGPYAPNELLKRAHRLFDGVVHSSETVVVSPGGNLTLLDKYGYVYEAEPASKAPNAVFPDEFVLDLPPRAYVGPGRPLGFHYDAHGNLIICDSLKGLTMLEKDTNRLVVLSNRVSPDSPIQPNSPLVYVNDLDISHQDGTIYFTDSQSIPTGPSPDGSFYDTFRSYLLGLYSGAFTGRLLRYTPSTGRTEVLVEGLWYANGVALGPGEEWVAVVETSRLRLMRHWLKGPKAGTTEVLIDRLPGFPDGVSRAPDGNLWVAVVAPVMPIVKLLRFKALRTIMAYLPPWARPRIPSWGAALKITPDGQPLRWLMDTDGAKVAFVSSITEHGGRLYFGNVRQHYVSYVDLEVLKD